MFSIGWFDVLASCIEELKSCWKACWETDSYSGGRISQDFWLDGTLWWLLRNEYKSWKQFGDSYVYCESIGITGLINITETWAILDCSPFSSIRKKSSRFIYNRTPKASQLECFFPPDYFFSCLWHVLTFLSVLSLQRHNVVSISATSTSKIKYIAEEYLFFQIFHYWLFSI